MNLLKTSMKVIQWQEINKTAPHMKVEIKLKKENPNSGKSGNKHLDIQKRTLETSLTKKAKWWKIESQVLKT